MSGWICSYRAIWDHPIFRGNAERVGVWDWMLKTAAWKDVRFNAGREVITLSRGQLCISQRQVSEATGMGRQALRTFLRLLESEGAIETRPATKLTQGRTLITICKYDKYQGVQPNANPSPTQDQPTKEQDNNIPVGTADKSASSELVDLSSPKAVTWAVGVAYLKPFCGDKKARAMIGKWLKKTGDDFVSVQMAFQAAKKAETQDPIPYIEKCLMSEEEKERKEALRIRNQWLGLPPEATYGP